MVINTTNGFLSTYNKVRHFPGGTNFQEKRPYVELSDGYRISIQASSNHYCSPREDGLTEYSEVELGFPNIEDELINDYAEDDDYTQTVYGYVPVDVVDALIKKHGGITRVRTLATPWSNGEEAKSGDIGWRNC